MNNSKTVTLLWICLLCLLVVSGCAGGRSSKKSCRGPLPMDHACCNGQVHKSYECCGYVHLYPHEICCGGRKAMDPRTHICCGGQVFEADEFDCCDGTPRPEGTCTSPVWF